MQAKGIGFLKFSGGEMADLIAYLYFLNYFDAPGDPVVGGRLFREKGCAGCHALNGVGGRVGPDLARADGLTSPIEVIVALWNHAASMERVMRERGVPWPRFRRGEIADILEYLHKARASASQ
jgi:mono/diheme cytochrome c family protein